jgi:hypothetical protein
MRHAHYCRRWHTTSLTLDPAPMSRSIFVLFSIFIKITTIGIFHKKFFDLCIKRGQVLVPPEKSVLLKRFCLGDLKSSGVILMANLLNVRILSDCLTLKMMERWSFETSVTTHTAAVRHTTQDWILQQHHCGKSKSQIHLITLGY